MDADEDIDGEDLAALVDILWFIDWEKEEPTDYPGRTEVGTLLWGAAVGANDDPVERHEVPAGHILTARRTFFSVAAQNRIYEW
jgi:hypothetical protein